VAGYVKFDPRGFLEAGGSPPKAPKAPKLEQTLGGLASLDTGLAKTETSSPIAHAWSETEEERAAVVEHDGGLPREWAEALARLDPSRAPADVPPKRWVVFLNDCGRFLDDGWAQHATGFGWTPFDLFGCDRHKPFARIDRAGLLWLLNGRKLLALTVDSAAIGTASGGKLTYRRYPNEAGRVLPWELQ
jgi:hypothetical protein